LGLSGGICFGRFVLKFFRVKIVGYEKVRTFYTILSHSSTDPETLCSTEM
jgi:putative alpha-1,2-mannosidase